jgi:hypothetical protein
MSRPPDAVKEKLRGFFPSNGTEGDMFREQFCERCIYWNQTKDEASGEDVGCPIWDSALWFGSHDNPPSQWVEDKSGLSGSCAMFQEASKSYAVRAERERLAYERVMRGE